MAAITIASFLRMATQQLSAAGITTARLDTLVLLGDELNKNSAQLLAAPETILSTAQQKVLIRQLARRAEHEPLAYIRGHAAFYGRTFAINRHVLVPRPESETIIDLFKELAGQAANANEAVLQVADVGTGSGILAITAKLEVPRATVYGIDIDPACVQLASHNAKQLGAAIECMQGDLLEPLRVQHRQPTILLCNLPYVPTDYPINQAATHEPQPAIFGGTDGLDLYRALFAQLEHIAWPAYVLAESLPAQHVVLTRIAHDSNFVLTQTQDFIQVFRKAPESSAL
ncbi:MAG TPA: HemK/PrmC family methyltransferase [Candidatus Saccharimonadales bacterium]|nr:HemK/PrmC family methyltransferase [Candidatus Saccharimonadales bacterium]